MPGDGPALLRIPDKELLGIIRVICEAIDKKTANRKFAAQTRYAADSQNCKTNGDLQEKLDADSISEDKTNIPNYLNSSTNKTPMPDYFNSNNNKKLTKE